MATTRWTGDPGLHIRGNAAVVPIAHSVVVVQMQRDVMGPCGVNGFKVTASMMINEKQQTQQDASECRHNTSTFSLSFVNLTVDQTKCRTAGLALSPAQTRCVHLLDPYRLI